MKLAIVNKRDERRREIRELEYLEAKVARAAQNSDGARMSPGLGNGWLYCGRVLGKDAIPDSDDGRCGPNIGPQCASCKRGSVPACGTCGRPLAVTDRYFKFRCDICRKTPGDEPKTAARSWGCLECDYDKCFRCEPDPSFSPPTCGTLNSMPGNTKFGPPPPPLGLPPPLPSLAPAP